uniref:hypothetical protein n=1 Tax=Algoriphagus sp. TaxID=1872435 RepID=UPI004047419E
MSNAERPIQNVEVGKTSFRSAAGYLAQQHLVSPACRRQVSWISALVSCFLALASRKNQILHTPYPSITGVEARHQVPMLASKL